MPWENQVVVPNTRYCRGLRRELTIVVETLAAYKIAKALSVRQLGTDATSRKKLELVTSNVIITDPGGKLVPIIMSGAHIARGATADIEANGVRSMFERGREKLGWWTEVVEELYPGVDFGENAIPDQELCCLGRLGGGGAVTSDSCNQDRKMCKILAQLIADDVKRMTGPEAWAAPAFGGRSNQEVSHRGDGVLASSEEHLDHRRLCGGRGAPEVAPRGLAGIVHLS